MMYLLLCIANILCLIFNVSVSNYPVAAVNLIAVVLCGSCAFDELKGKL